MDFGDEIFFSDDVLVYDLRFYNIKCSFSLISCEKYLLLFVILIACGKKLLEVECTSYFCKLGRSTSFPDFLYFLCNVYNYHGKQNFNWFTIINSIIYFKNFTTSVIIIEIYRFILELAYNLNRL